MGTKLSRLVTYNEIFPLLEKTMLWFKENADGKERLGMVIDRLGEEKWKTICSAMIFWKEEKKSWQNKPSE